MCGGAHHASRSAMASQSEGCKAGAISEMAASTTGATGGGGGGGGGGGRGMGGGTAAEPDSDV